MVQMPHQEQKILLTTDSNMLNSEKFISELPKSIFYVGGSYAIKKQYSWFRDYSDIDVITTTDFIEMIVLKAEKSGAICDTEQWSQWFYHSKMVFPDWSKIDLLYWKTPNEAMEIDWIRYFSVKDVLIIKWELYKKYKELGDVDKYVKHWEDILWGIENWLIIIK